MKRLLVLFIICLSSLIVLGSESRFNESFFVEEENSQNVSKYFFPLGECAYSIKPDESESVHNGIIYYSFAPAHSGRTLIEERKVFVNGQTLTTNKLTNYFVERNTVYSKQHTYQNPFSKQYESYNDVVTLFVFPISDTEAYKWVETSEGAKYTCKSEYVYVKYSNDDCAKVVKITKESAFTTQGEKHINKEWTYWESGRGRIATFNSLDAQPAVMESMLNVAVSFYGMQEIEKDEYDRLFQIMKDKPFMNFVSALVPIELYHGDESINYLEEMISVLMQKEDSTIGKRVSTKVDIDIDYQGIVTISGKDLKTHIIPIIEDSVKKMLLDQRIKQPIREDRRNGFSAPSPISITIFPQFYRKNITTTMVHKKDHWDYDKKSTIPETEIKGTLKEIADNYLLNNPKVKVIEVQIDYFVVGYDNKAFVLSNNVQKVK